MRKHIFAFLLATAIVLVQVGMAMAAMRPGGPL